MDRKRKNQLLKLARRNGGIVKDGGKHIKVYDPDGNYVASLSHGSHAGFEGPGDMKFLEKKWRELGWM